MAIMKIKEKEEVGKFIETLRNENGWNNSELGRRLGEAKGLPDGQAVPRDTVSKWIRGDLYPGIDNIYYLAQVFGVTMEYILMAGSERDKFDDRPFSLYAVAKSGDVERLEQLMRTENEYDRAIIENYDEFDKTILDYLIEFRRVDLIKYMFQQGYITLVDTRTGATMYLKWLSTSEKTFYSFVELALEEDDAELFGYLISRTRPILQRQEEGSLEAFCESEYRDGYIFSRSMIEKLLKAEKIFTSYMEFFTLSNEEWESWNRGIVFYKGNNAREELCEIKSVPTLASSFNLVLNYALLNEHIRVNKMLDFAIETRKETQAYLASIPLVRYVIHMEGRVIADSMKRGCVAIVGVVLPSVYEKLTGKLKEKCKALLCDKVSK